MGFLTKLRKSKKISERDFAAVTGLARETLRSCEQGSASAKLGHLEKVAQALDWQLLLGFIPNAPARSERSVVAVSYAICNDGFDSWKIHLMNFVDDFRRTKDVRLILLPPIAALDRRLQALFAAIVHSLCEEIELAPPDWVQKENFLPQPWFVAGMESLKAAAIVESPLAFRRHNIFVQENFLRRV